MVTQTTHIQIEKLSLPRDPLDAPLRQAFADAESQNPQFGENWLTNLTSHALDEHDEAVIYVARRSAENFIACPLKLNSRDKTAQSLSTFYTSVFAPIIYSDDPESLFRALFEHLAKSEKLSMLTLFPMDNRAAFFTQIQNSLEQTGWKGRHDFFCFGNWIHNVETVSYESYLSTRPSSLRNTVARKTRKFVAQDRGRLAIVHGGSELEEAIAHYVFIYNNSWKQEEPYPDFIPGLLRLAATHGWLRLGIAYYDNVPVASQIWLVHSGTAYIFKLAYHEDHKRLSPGTVLTAHMMERVIEEDGIAEIDYLSGDDAYKADWMSQRRELHGIAAYNSSTAEGLAMFLRYKVKGVLKKYWKKKDTH